MGRMEEADRLLLAATVDAGVLPELLVHPDGDVWVVRQNHSNVIVSFPNREQATAFAKTWATGNPPCVVKVCDAAL
jgi:hypothetical protein